jgi:hypothetical protein
VPTDDVWPEAPDEVERRLRSAVAVAEFARSSADLHAHQRKRLMNEAIWFWTERGSVSLKYRLRYRTPAALKLQRALGLTAAAKLLRHEHVHERATVVIKLLSPDTDIRAVLRATHACVVTKEEHVSLTTTAGTSGWQRYINAGIHPIDMATELPMNLNAAIAADALVWG